MPADDKTEPPMANGELVFDAPWQGRVFGIARSLCEAGFYSWDEFRDYLIREVEDWDHSHEQGMEYQYYDRFLAALEKLLADRELCLTDERSLRIDAYSNRPHGHDH
jgi:nitrile hydratase accessory protein